MFDSIMKAFPMLGTAAKGFTDAFKFEMDGLLQVWHALLDLIDKLWEKIKGAPSAVINWIGKHLAAVTGEHYVPIGGGSPGLPKDNPTALAKTSTGQSIAQKLVASGWTPEQAAGIAGSFMQESGGDPTARNKTSGAYGLGQWLGSRRKDFETYSGKPLEGSSLDDQIAFFNYETTHKEKRAGDLLRQAKTASEAAEIHSKYYERPGAAEANIARRQQYADMIYKGQQQIAGTNTPLATTSSQAIANSAARSNSVHVDARGMTIATQATDSKAIASTFYEHLRTQINDAVDAHDDGVAI
jgi:hypothetical protein